MEIPVQSAVEAGRFVHRDVAVVMFVVPRFVLRVHSHCLLCSVVGVLVW